MFSVSRKPLCDRLAWEWRIIQRAWADTRSLPKRLGLAKDLSFLAAAAGVSFLRRYPEMSLIDALWIPLEAILASVVVLGACGLWNYIWTPFRQDRELRDEITSLSQEKEKSVSISVHSPRKEDSVFLDVVNLEKSEQMKLVVTWFGSAPPGLITPYALPWKDQRGEYRHVPKHTPERIRLCGFLVYGRPIDEEGPGTAVFAYERAHADPVEQEVRLSSFFSDRPNEYWGDAGFQVAAISKTRGLLDQFLVVLRVKAIMDDPERVLLETTVAHTDADGTSSRGRKLLYRDGMVNR